MTSTTRPTQERNLLPLVALAAAIWVLMPHVVATVAAYQHASTGWVFPAAILLTVARWPGTSLRLAKAVL